MRNMASAWMLAAATAARWATTTPTAAAFVVRSSTSLSRAYHATSSSLHMAASEKVPITLLSGFLGSGKTCTLQHLLENTQGLKIGVIVNDVASVNIDAKLVAGKKEGIVELQNGCACCSLAEELLTSVESVLGGRELDAVVVELSGVADPVAIKSNWFAAKLQKHPVTERADVSQVVTLVDASTFGTDWMTWDVAGERKGWVDPADDCAAQRKVPELLAEQIEAADIILLNKMDIAGPDQLKVAAGLVKELNDKAIVETVEFGKVEPGQVLRKSKTESHSNDHDHDCHDPGCQDQSHSHSHEHASGCSEPDCTDTSHSHSHNHLDEACSDPDCTDTSHSHSHSHSTSTDQLGITNFVYKADRPFNLRKLMMLLNAWPVPIKENLDLTLIEEAKAGGYVIEGAPDESPFMGVLRSKGFCWFAPTKWSGPQDDVWRHDTAMYWSHAGKHFGISSAGKWWGTISRDQMKQYFKDDTKEYERILSEDFVTEEFGDRRQEIVFIGVGLDQEEIVRYLDQCLLTEKGMDRYRQELSNYRNTVLTTSTGRAGLFDVGGVDHMDIGK